MSRVSMEGGTKGRTFAVHPLCQPRGVRFRCALCAQQARRGCLGGCLTFYCGEKHAAEDNKAGVHDLVCSRLAHMLCNPDSRHIRVQLLLEICTGARRLLSEHKPEVALVVAMAGLRQANILGKRWSVWPLLFLGQANLRLGHLAKAEVHLARATWVSRRPRASGPETTPLPRTRAGRWEPGVLRVLHRTWGLLYAAHGLTNLALHHFSLSVYLSTEAYGSHDVRTATECSHFAQALATGPVRAAADTVVDVWLDYLQRMKAQESGDLNQGTSGDLRRGVEEQRPTIEGQEGAISFNSVSHPMETFERSDSQGTEINDLTDIDLYDDLDKVRATEGLQALKAAVEFWKESEGLTEGCKTTKAIQALTLLQESSKTSFKME
uniref:zinc finger MYND domain-containing protein 12 isoform X2 n=1 Tax=Myxine glutinosa TaxID=7769 RepID=UPI00358FEF5B